MARHILLFCNLISLALSVICSLSLGFHRIPPTVPEAIAADASGLSKDQVVTKLVTANLAVDHASNLLWFFLSWWLGISLLNFIILVFTSLSKPKPNRDGK